MLQRRGESTFPCGTLFAQGTGSDVRSPTRTEHVRLLRQELSRETSASGTPACLRMRHSAVNVDRLPRPEACEWWWLAHW